MIEIVPYEPEHIDQIMEHPRIWEIKTSLCSEWEDWKKRRKEEGPAYTLMVDGYPLGCAGVLIMDNNIGEAWMILSSLFNNYKKLIYSALKKNLDAIISEHRLVGVQAFIDPEFEKAKHMIEHLGFTEDGLVMLSGMPMIRFWRAC